MSRVVVSEFVSLDGVMEDPGGAEGTEHGGWTFQFDQGADGVKFKVDELTAADALLLGAVTYRGFAAAWPSMEGTGEFGERMNSIRKYVVSSTLTDADASWNNTTVIRGDVPAEVAKLKAHPGGDLLVAGSGQLARSLIDLGLVDEYRLMVFPIVLGSGKRLFSGISGTPKLSLVEAKTTGSGLLLLTYQPA
ncbi:MAG TPA: dihydrofolate reductase family protein [Acidimicrobiales bacterium]|nr:dihydrofolate reductase family protein [Acidimicrobiales bacterium]